MMNKEVKEALGYLKSIRDELHEMNRINKARLELEKKSKPETYNQSLWFSYKPKKKEDDECGERE